MGVLVHECDAAPVEAQSTAKHGPPPGQVTPGPAAQLPPRQTSGLVQPFPSASQGVPSALLRSWQPVVGEQTADVHGPLPSHTTGWPPPHLPSWQVPVLATMQALPLSQGALDIALLRHLPLLHTSSVHGFLSSHSALPVQAHWLMEMHWPLSHLSTVQSTPSLQIAVASGLWLQPAAPVHASVVHGLASSHWPLSPLWLQLPVALSHLSMVHGTPSSQALGVPMQTPEAHWSPEVH